MNEQELGRIAWESHPDYDPQYDVWESLAQEGRDLWIAVGKGVADAVQNDPGTRLQKREQQVQTVRGAIIGALAGGHIDGTDGAAYSKNVLRQIADLLDIELPESE